MLHQYKLTYTRTGYNQKIPVTQSATIEGLDQDSAVSLATYRLGGFQRDIINPISVEYIGPRPVLDLSSILDGYVTIDVYTHIEETLGGKNENLENKCLELVENNQAEDYGEALEKLGYIEAVHDNTYNYCSDLSDDIDFKVFTLGEPSDWIYDDTAIVLIEIHGGIDARTGYSFHGLYNNRDHDGLCYFLDFHVRVFIELDNEEVEDIDGDGAISRLLDEYPLIEVTENGDILAKKDGTTYNVNIYHPAMGV